jgi:hypothetical protein
MRYGERLQIAIARREVQLNRVIPRKELARVAECAVQNIGMVLKGSRGEDQKLSTASHSKVAAFLKVNPDWLLDETGSIELATKNDSKFTFAALELAAIFDMIPIEDRLLRAEAFSLATTAIAEVIRRSQAKHHGTAGSGYGA